jgi:hypothetical protein
MSASSFRRRLLVLPVFLGIATALASCQKIAGWMTARFGSRPAPSDQAGELSLERRNSEILQEIYRVVWVVDPPSPSEFGTWLNSINQGASFEGVYNAFTHSTVQRRLESDPKSSASPAALGAFAAQLARLLLEMPEVPEFTARDARPLATIDPLEESVAEDESRKDGLKPGPKTRLMEFAPLAGGAGRDPVPPTRPSFEVLSSKLASAFNGASVFTLKRVLGDWALKVMARLREESPERLWSWYVDFAIEGAALKVDFGLRLRSDTDRSFHRSWAEKAGEDLIRWEVLNRLHRILNTAQPIRIESRE